jgi:hypothetical protein
MRKMRNHKICLGRLKGRDYLKDAGKDQRITLKWTLGKQGGTTDGTGFIWFRT